MSNRSSRRARRATAPTTPTSARGAPPRTPVAPSRSAGPSGALRAGRRQTDRPTPDIGRRSFVSRNRGPIVAVVAIAVVAVGAVLLLLSTSQSAFACESQLTLAPSATAAPGAPSPAPGQAQEDMGRAHVSASESVRYLSCPPASGPHYNATGEGPITARFYGKDEPVVPQGWVHNLEHGGLVILYRCGANDDCSDPTLAPLRALVGSLPASPVCKIPAGEVSPVIARFDQMSTPYAALVWDHVLLLQHADVPAILDFYQKLADRTNPEPQCSNTMAAPSASPSASQ